MAHVSEEEKARFRRQAEDLAKIETDDPGTPERRREVLAWINARRAERGLPAWPDEDEERPELEFYRRAKALGMARSDR